jgi:hypothetical protein
MSTELALVNESDLLALAAEMGASQEDLNGGGDYIPALKVWLEEDGDEEDAPRLKGKMYVEGMDELVFAKPGTVRFRPLTHTFQWTQWDDVAKKVTNRTRLIFSFKEEARDEKGTVRCGKPPSKEIRENPALKDKYDDITTYRRVQGLVSYTGITKTGEEREVKDVVCGINAKGASFTQFDEEYVKKMPAKSNLWDFEAEITLSKEKNGSVTYYVPHYNVDWSNKLRLTVPVFDTIKGLKDRIDQINKGVDQKYYDALHSGKEDTAAIEALKDVSKGRPAKGGASLEDDLDIPF